MDYLSLTGKIITAVCGFWYKIIESIFVTNKQYRLRFLDCYTASNNKIIAIIQVAIKRVKIKLSVRYLASNKNLLQDLHPVSACRIAFIANITENLSLDHIPNYIRSAKNLSPVIKENPTLKIISRELGIDNKKTRFTIAPIATPYENRITLLSKELAKNDVLLYGLGSVAAASVGIAASEDYLNEINKHTFENKEMTVKHPPKFTYYHILCVSYVGLVLSGISIVRRLFPFTIPFTDIIVPFGAGILFFPLTFFIQDVTTEVYGFSRARHMVWLAIVLIIFYMSYTQIAIHLPSGTDAIYKNNESFTVVFNTLPRQLIALIVSLFAGMLINDFFISKSKIIFGGQYLWARILGSTMIGEAVLQVVGGVIGFSDTLNFYTQLLPNMILAYGYKMLWNAGTVPIIYLVASYLKRKEGIDTFDYDINYNPFKLSIAS